MKNLEVEKQRPDAIFLLVISFGVICWSCSGSEELDNYLKGNLKLNVYLTDITNKTSEAKTKNSTVQDLVIGIYKSGSEDPEYTYGSITELPESIELPEGEYYASAASSDVPAAAFESPCYSGKSDSFTILSGETSEISLTCSLANIVVTIAYSDQVISLFSDYSATVSNTSGSLTFSKDETRAGYFNSGPLNITVDLKYTSEGETRTKTLSGQLSGPQTGKHYEITVDTSPDAEAGDVSLTISFDDNIETISFDLTDDGFHENSDYNFGDILITEVMYNPKSMSDAYGEWMELYNNSEKEINLNGLVIRRGSDLEQISSDVLVAPGGYVLLAETDSAAANVDYVYGTGFSLTNSGFELSVSTYGTDGTDGFVIFDVDFTAEGFPSASSSVFNGKSIQLAPSVRDAEAAQDGSNWCAATALYSTGDYGTPGEENSECD